VVNTLAFRVHRGYPPDVPEPLVRGSKVSRAEAAVRLHTAAWCHGVQWDVDDIPWSGGRHCDR